MGDQLLMPRLGFCKENDYFVKARLPMKNDVDYFVEAMSPYGRSASVAEATLPYS